MAEGTTTLLNVPPVEDVHLLLQIIEGLGAAVERDWARKAVTIDASRLTSDTPDSVLVGRLRGSLMLMAPLLARLGSCKLAAPGGCSIGARKFDIHLDGLRSLGARIDERGPEIEASCLKLVGATLVLDMPTHTGTQQLVMAAVTGQGTTTIWNASQEPEVAQLCRSLVLRGAKISGIATSRLTVEGVKGLRGGTVVCSPSRLETSLFAMIGCLPGAHLVIEGAAREAEPVLTKLREMGANFRAPYPQVLEVEGISPRGLICCKAATWPYPGFPTDAQPHLMALSCFAKGRSEIRENVYENRFRHVPELCRMGAEISIFQETAYITGPRPLDGTDVVATDLQAGAALLLAALGARGTTYIHSYQHLARGYPNLVQRLNGLCTIGTCDRTCLTASSDLVCR